MYTMMFLYLICSVIYVFLGVITYFNNKKDRLNQTFLVLCIVMFFWTFCLALMSATLDANVATFFRILAVFSWAPLYSILLIFIICLTENDSHLKSIWYYIIIFIPTLISLYLYVLDPVEVTDIVKIKIGWAFLNPSGKSLLWDVFFNTYYSTYMIIVLILLIKWYKTTTLERQKKQAKIIFVTMIMTFILGSLTDVIFPFFGVKMLPPTTVFIALSIMSAISYSMIKYGLMLITNEKIVSDVFEIMNEGLIILEHDYTINAINQGALNMLDYQERDLINKSVEVLFKEENIVDLLDHSSSQELEILKKSDKSLPILASTSVLLDNFGDRLGNLLIFQDLSEYKMIQNELERAYDDLEVKVRNRTYELTKANNQLGMEIGIRIEIEEQIKDLAFNDQLTGLPNRKSFNKILNQIIKKAYKTKSKFAVLFLDLDGFKMINDTLGHDKGDYLLEKVAIRLKLLLGENDFLARIGGDEFIILTHNFDSEDEIKEICKMILKSFDYPFNLSVGDIYTSTSIGVATYPNDGDDAKELVKNADIAMYKSKESGKGNYLFYKSVMLDNLNLTLKLTNDLHRSIDQGELEVFYQPQNDTFAHNIRGVEALVRWNHPILGTIGPDLFIPIAEHTGLIMEIGGWVLDQACKDFNKLREISKDITSLGVNLSVNQIRSSSLVKQVKSTLEKNQVEPKHLELEITESCLLNDADHILDILDQLKSLRVRIAVDDFGTDYSSLRYLKQLPLDRIKIAKNFIDGIGSSKTDEAIIAAIIYLGRKLDLNLIAEGVEFKEQLDFLSELACDEIQGFYFNEPMTFEKLECVLRQSMSDSEDMHVNSVERDVSV